MNQYFYTKNIHIHKQYLRKIDRANFEETETG